MNRRGYVPSDPEAEAKAAAELERASFEELEGAARLFEVAASAMMLPGERLPYKLQDAPVLVRFGWLVAFREGPGGSRPPALRT